MKTRFVAVLELLLLFPALLFMGALVVRELQPLQYEPAHSAQQLVMWYAGRMWTLWLLLLALPLTVLVTGCATLAHSWNRETALPDGARQLPRIARAHFATLLVALTTLAAAGILAIVILHMLAN
jgi:hypothetical protein